MITIDLRWLFASGIGTYLRNITPGIIKAFPERKFCLLGDSKEMQKFDWAKSSRIQLIEAQSPMYSISEQFEIVKKIPKETQLYFATHYNIPLLYKGRILVTIYDLFHVAMPKLVGGIRKRLYAKFMFYAARRKASAIITISRFTKNELIRYTGKESQQIYPIHLGVDDSWFKIIKSDNPYQKPYLLFVGNVKPHKNLTNLIRAFQLLIDKLPHDLIIVGKKEGFITGDKKVFSMVSRIANRVKFTGYVSDVILKQYFAFADALVFPSLYEGFGLPPLEAMAAGCPVIVSNRGALPEVCEDAAIYCNPEDPKDIADKILTVINNPALQENLRTKGKDHSRKFSWEKCALETSEIIGELLK